MENSNGNVVNVQAFFNITFDVFDQNEWDIEKIMQQKDYIDFLKNFYYDPDAPYNMLYTFMTLHMADGFCQSIDNILQSSVDYDKKGENVAELADMEREVEALKTFFDRFMQEILIPHIKEELALHQLNLKNIPEILSEIYKRGDEKVLVGSVIISPALKRDFGKFLLDQIDQTDNTRYTACQAYAQFVQSQNRAITLQNVLDLYECYGPSQTQNQDKVILTRTTDTAKFIKTAQKLIDKSEKQYTRLKKQLTNYTYDNEVLYDARLADLVNALSNLNDATIMYNTLLHMQMREDMKYVPRFLFMNRHPDILNNFHTKEVLTSQVVHSGKHEVQELLQKAAVFDLEDDIMEKIKVPGQVFNVYTLEDIFTPRPKKGE